MFEFKSLLSLLKILENMALPQGLQVINIQISPTTTVPSILHLPVNFDPQKKYPLLLFLHGTGEAGTDPSKIYASASAGGPSYFIAQNKWPETFINKTTGESFQFIVVSPQSPSWSISASQLVYVIADVQKKYPVNQSAIFLTGLSAGGGSVTQYCGNLNVQPVTYPAMMVPMSPVINDSDTAALSQKIVSNKIYTWAFGSDPADLFGINAHHLINDIQAINKSMGDFTNYSGGHCCWNRFYDPAYKDPTLGLSIYEKMVSLIPATKPVPKTVIYTPDATGRLLVKDLTMNPGDIIRLSGNFKSVAFENIVGDPGAPLLITNVPGAKLTIGDPAWSGGSYAEGLVLRNCQNIEICGDLQSGFVINGSVVSDEDASGNQIRTAYIDLCIADFCQGIKVHDLIIKDGGVGLYCKTNVSATNTATWYPNTILKNFEFFNLNIGGTYNEAMYIGHTATYWNISTNTPYYPAPGAPVPDPSVYKQPLKLTNVKIHHCYIHDIGNDGIQTAAIEGLEINNNEVYNWALKKGPADNGGILIGGRVKGFNVHDNYVHDSWGELLQIYADEDPNSIIKNNLLVRGGQDGLSIRGNGDLAAQIIQNTIACCGGNLVRINGYYGDTAPHILQRNLLINPLFGKSSTIYPVNYIYLENGGAAEDSPVPQNNPKYATIGDAGVSETNWFQPKPLTNTVSTATPAYGFEIGTLLFTSVTSDAPGNGAASGDNSGSTTTPSKTVIAELKINGWDILVYSDKTVTIN